MAHSSTAVTANHRIAARHDRHDLCRDRDSLPDSRIGHVATYRVPLCRPTLSSHSVVALHVLVLHVVIMCLSVLHDVSLTVCDVDQQPVTQRRYCGPVKRRQASQKVTDLDRHGPHGATRLRGCASTPTCRALSAPL